jgi:hypothetical protein
MATLINASQMGAEPCPPVGSSRRRRTGPPRRWLNSTAINRQYLQMIAFVATYPSQVRTQPKGTTFTP